MGTLAELRGSFQILKNDSHFSPGYQFLGHLSQSPVIGIRKHAFVFGQGT